MTVDVGAEAMLNRRPEGVDLARELDLEIVHPTAAASRLWTRGELRPLPRSLMGVPLDLDGLAASGVLSDEGLARVRAGADAAAHSSSTATSRSATWSPAGSATRSSTGWSSRCSAACTPATLACSRPAPPPPSWSPSPSAAARSSRPPPTLPTSRRTRLRRPPRRHGPPAAGPRRTPSLFAARTDATVRELRRTPDGRGFELVVGETRDPETLTADARRPGHPRRAHRPPPRAPRPAGRGRARRDRVRVDGRGHPRLPRRRGRRAPPRLVRLPGPARRRPADQGLDVLLRQVGLGPRGRPRRRRRRGRRCCCAPRSAGTARSSPSRSPTTSWSPSSLADLADATGLRARPSTATSSAGAADSRSTPSATSTGSTDPRRRGPGPRAGGLRRGVRRRRHPRRHRLGPAGGGPGRRGRGLSLRRPTAPSAAVRSAYAAASLRDVRPRPAGADRPAVDRQRPA